MRCDSFTVSAVFISSSVFYIYDAIFFLPCSLCSFLSFISFNPCASSSSRTFVLFPCITLFMTRFIQQVSENVNSTKEHFCCKTHSVSMLIYHWSLQECLVRTRWGRGPSACDDRGIKEKITAGITFSFQRKTKMLGSCFVLYVLLLIFNVY